MLEAVLRRGRIHLHSTYWIDFPHADAPDMTVVGQAINHDNIWHHNNQDHNGPPRQRRNLLTQILQPVASRVVLRRTPSS